MAVVWKKIAYSGDAPTAHNTSHENGGGDEIDVVGLSGLLADDQHVLDAEVKLIKLDDFATPDDNTDLDFGTVRHGLVPKGTNVGDYLKDDGTWAAVAAGGVDTSGTPVTNDIARFTDADTIEGRSYTEFKADLDLEVGTDMLAQQTIGIADNNLLEVDHVSPADNDYAKFTLNGLEGRSYSEVRGDINVEDGSTADLTGLEIVTLLEALAGGSQLSHDQLDDVSTSDHHTKYTDANARSAAVSDAIYGAGWNGVTTIAPSKNAVYDKIETLGAGATIVRKTADEIVNNSITLQNDDHLLFAIGANEIWEITLYLRTISATSAPDIRYNWAVPSGAEYAFKDWTTALATVDIIESTFNTVVTYISKAYVINGATPGNMQFQWAQRAATSEDTKVLTNSFIVAHQIL